MKGRKFGLLTSRKLEIHFLILFGLSVVTLISISGFFSLVKWPLFSEITFVSALVTSLVVVAAEIVIKSPLLKYFYDKVLRWFGVLLLVVQWVLFFIASLAIPKFKFGSIGKSFVFVLVFMIIRVLLINVIRPYTYKERKL